VHQADTDEHDQERRIAELADAGPVELQEVCGAEAQAIVADIEAGRR
jgi:hypothetical protein